MYDYRKEIERLTVEIAELEALGIKDGKDYPVGEYCGALDALKARRRIMINRFYRLKSKKATYPPTLGV